MQVEQVAIPTLHLGADEVVAGIKIHGRERALGSENFLAALVKRMAACLIGGGAGFGDQPVILGVLPARLVVAVVTRHDVQKSARVEVVADPSEAGDRVVSGAHSVAPDFALLVVEPDFDAEIFAPHLLHGLGDLAVALVGVEENLEFRETCAAGETGFGEQLLRGGDVLRHAGGRGEAGDAGWAEVSGGGLLSFGDVAHDARPVDAHREGAAHADIVERRLGDIETVDVGREQRGGVVGGRFLGLVNGDFGDGQRAGDVKLAGAEGAFLRVGAFDRIEDDLAEFHGGAVPVVFVAHAADELVGLPIDEGKVAVADEIAGARPKGAAAVGAPEFLERGAVHGIPSGVADHGGQIRYGVVEREHEGAIVGRAGADERGVGDFARVEGLAVFEGEEERSVFGGELGAEHPAVGEDEVVRGDGIAVGPLGVGAEVKGPGEVVGGDSPALGDGGDGLASLGVVLGEALEEGHDEVERLLAIGDVRVEIVGLGKIAEVEDLVAVAGDDVGLALGATDEHDRQSQHEQGESEQEGAERRHGKRWAQRKEACEREPGLQSTGRHWRQPQPNPTHDEYNRRRYRRHQVRGVCA